MIPLGPIGLAGSNPFTDDATVVADEAREVEDLGYATLWRSGNLPMVAAALRATTTIPVATGIVAVSRVPAVDVIAAHRELPGGRFLLGLGGAHGAHPIRTLNAYLDDLDAAGVGTRVLAALGPNMLDLARDRTAGAYPYLVTPEWVTGARIALGPERLLAVLLMVVPTRDRETAHRAVAGPLEFLAAQGGYRRNLLRQGFTEADIDSVSDPLLDGIAAWGDHPTIVDRVGAYRAAGADQVVLRILGTDEIATARAELARRLIG